MVQIDLVAVFVDEVDFLFDELEFMLQGSFWVIYVLDVGGVVIKQFLDEVVYGFFFYVKEEVEFGVQCKLQFGMLVLKLAG